MYDYVRRQQELQPALFATKTFHWMEPGHQRQASWTHKYTRPARDPLAHSSSSIFAGTAASASPARTLFAFRRTRPRQLSDAARRPPSGVSGTFVARRRGFTAPAGVARPMVGLQPREAEPMTSAAESIAEESSDQPSGDQPADAEAKGVLFSSASQPTGASPNPLPVSSFSPPLSPQPRTICHRARTLMHRVRMLKPDGQHNARRRQQQQQHRRRHDERQQQARTPFTISSVLCTFDNGTLPRRGVPNTRPAPNRQPAINNPPSSALNQPQPASNHGPPRRLPRSPLANPPTITSIPSSSSEDEDEDDEALRCHGCARYRGAEWIVTCAASHALCFGCVQAYVRTLAHTPGAPVPCLLTGCAAQIARAQLRRCLPPQRMRQLDGARPPTRNPAAAWDAMSSDEGFDMPLVPEEPEDAVCRSMATLAVSRDDVAERAAMSMPALGGRTSAGSGPMLSERTCVGRASHDSVVAVAALAADSDESLSPQSVGSRLRRVPKAHEPLSAVPPESEYLPESLVHLARLRPADSADMSEALGAPLLYDYAGDSHLLRTPVQVRHDAYSFASTGSPVSWQQPPPLPPALPASFRASSTWITPGQRHSGYAENMLLSATLFETIRRKPSPEAASEEEEEDLYSILDLDDSSLVGCESRTPSAAQDLQGTPGVASTLAPTPVVVQKRDEDAGVYIPTWRRAEAGARKTPLWAADEFGSQSGVLCEAAELNFDLYETLHRRR
ncbi:hypothetical protein GGI15_000522 [Coemansia interrupta]|uniref:Uncharacterized protein n=1 Tax=Coemansia interrupta TaxID=1126814 RepID=A0A9W8LNU8_9FUNG|nr:hypothetical protein GGI15_000522 [Coemansia interrupta]